MPLPFKNLTAAAVLSIAALTAPAHAEMIAKSLIQN